MTPTASVGPYRFATDGDEIRFACLLLRGDAVWSPERWLECGEVQSQQDWSAFGAAKAFVDTVGEAEAIRAANYERQ